MDDARPAEVIYLDHSASTPVMPEVVEAMLAHLRDGFANPSGIHRQARNERRAIDDARDGVASVLGCAPGEVVFTSGGTESDNLALLGIERRERIGGVVVSAIEHRGVLEPAKTIGARLAPVGTDGVIDLDALSSMVDETTELVSIMAVNNEVGTVQPIARVVEMVRSRAPSAIVHCDAVQALAWLDTAEMTRGCDLVSVSAHKVGGPKGTGALVVRERARSRLHPIVYGGSQERGLRAGTENVAGIVGFAVAATLTRARLDDCIARVRALRDRFVDGIVAAEPQVHETVDRALRHGGNAHLAFPGTVNEEMLLVLDQLGIAASAGSSCASGALEPSHVLTAMGMTPSEARSCVRFSLGATTTEHEIDAAIELVQAAYRQLTARGSA